MRLRNVVAHDLGSPKYRQRIKEPKKRHLIDEIREKEVEEEIQIERTIDKDFVRITRRNWTD
jgi:hypothetical protein